MLGCFQIHKETPENILYRGSKFISFIYFIIISIFLTFETSIFFAFWITQ